MIEIGSIASQSTNLASGGAVSTDYTPDLSYHPYPGKSGADAQDATMSFDDFLDMINPLQHIPLVSSIYRGITGDTISPVARIAGDALYGGVMGIASAGLAALGAIGDEVVAANNDGKDLCQTVVASLSGSDSEDAQLASANNPQADTSATASSPIQLAAAAAPLPTQAPQQLSESAPASPQIQVVAATERLQTPAPEQSPILEIPTFTAATQAEAPAQTAAAPETSAAPTTPVAENAPVVPTAAASNGAGPGMPLDRSKMPYGGVMDTSMMQNAQQNQALALAMASSAGALQAQHTLRNSRFATNSTLSPVLSGSATNPMTSAAIQAPASPQTANALQNLLAELQASKGINQYKNAAQSTPAPGGALNITN
jgi:hypothetical protein